MLDLSKLTLFGIWDQTVIQIRSVENSLHGSHSFKPKNEQSFCGIEEAITERQKQRNYESFPGKSFRESQKCGTRNDGMRRFNFCEGGTQLSNRHYSTSGKDFSECKWNCENRSRTSSEFRSEMFAGNLISCGREMFCDFIWCLRK